MSNCFHQRVTEKKKQTKNNRPIQQTPKYNRYFVPCCTTSLRSHDVTGSNDVTRSDVTRARVTSLQRVTGQLGASDAKTAVTG